MTAVLDVEADVHDALRALVLTAVAADTGTMALAATATGFTRLTGSFVDDGFEAGLEVVPSGFPTNAPVLITSVSALEVTTRPAPPTAASASGRRLVVGLPLLRGWENVEVQPAEGHAFLEEDYVPAPPQLLTQSSSGTTERTGLYVLRLYGPPKVASRGLSRLAAAVLAVATPGSTITSAAGTRIHLGVNPAPGRSQIRQAKPGFAVVTVTLPFRFHTTNPS